MAIQLESSRIARALRSVAKRTESGVYEGPRQISDAPVQTTVELTQEGWASYEVLPGETTPTNDEGGGRASNAFIPFDRDGTDDNVYSPEDVTNFEYLLLNMDLTITNNTGGPITKEVRFDQYRYTPDGTDLLFSRLQAREVTIPAGGDTTLGAQEVFPFLPVWIPGKSIFVTVRPDGANFYTNSSFTLVRWPRGTRPPSGLINQ